MSILLARRQIGITNLSSEQMEPVLIHKTSSRSRKRKLFRLTFPCFLGGFFGFQLSYES